MPHDVSLVSTIAIGLGLALVLGYAASRIGVPPLVGYLLAGIVAGPHTPGFVGDVVLAGQLAEIGVMLMMFGVGLHLSIDDLLAVRRVALPGALAQIAVATALGAGLAALWGWSLGAALLFGLSLSVASTVVLLRALEARGELNTLDGRIAVGWLVVEDVFMVLALVLLPPLAPLLGAPVEQGADGPAALAPLVALTLGKVVAFVALMVVVGRRLFPKLLWLIARSGSRELFTLGVISAAVGIAYGAAQLFDVSFALGAFFAGMMMRESALSHRAAEESLPLRDAFSVLFFVSVGMLFEPAILVERPLAVLAVVATVILGKTLAAVAIVVLFRYPLHTALTVGASLAQIGEFSFILAALGADLGLLPSEAQSLVLAAALISIALNPLVFAAIPALRDRLAARFEVVRALEHRADPLAVLPSSIDSRRLTGHVLLVGYGRVGRRIAEALEARGLTFVVAEQNRELVERLRARGIPAVSGDASEPEVLIQAHVARCSVLVIAMADVVALRRMVETARMLNPRVATVLRTHSDEEAEILRRDGLGDVFMGEHELAGAMTRHVLERVDALASV